MGRSRSPCPFCGTQLEISIEPLGADGAPLRAKPRLGERLPWDDATAGGLVARFFDTVRLLLRSPSRALRRLAKSSIASIPRAIAFAALALFPSLAVQLAVVWLVFTRPDLVPFLGLPRLVADPSMLSELFLYLPLAATFAVLFLATSYQVASAIAASRRPPVERTILGVCFGFAPMVLAIVPVVGLLVGGIWSLVLHAIALRELHGLGRAQAALVVLSPLLVITLSIVYGG